MPLIEDLKDHALELVRRCAIELPDDVIQAIMLAKDREEEGSVAGTVLDNLLKNVKDARDLQAPLCQDTGTPIFYVWYSRDHSMRDIRDTLEWAVQEASARAYLRPNAVHSITGKNSGNNMGAGFPAFHFEEVDEPGIRITLMLKGGGSENCGVQYTVPDKTLGAGRDLAGVRKCVLDAAFKAQGYGCAPGILGVCIGGDRNTSFEQSKKTFFRKFGERNEDPELASMESSLVDEINSMGIGPMGFGGKTTVLDVRLTHAHRLPASFFVSVSYMCWAFRRHTMTFSKGGVSYD